MLQPLLTASRRGFNETLLLQVVLACHLILTIASADPLIMLNPQNIKEKFSTSR